MTLEQEVAFDFEYSYQEGERGERDYPGFPPEATITKVWLNGVEIPLKAISDTLYEQMIEAVFESRL
jgi:hypothetical protein